MLNQDVGEKDIWDSNASSDGLPSQHKDRMESTFLQPPLPGRASVAGRGAGEHQHGHTRGAAALYEGNSTRVTRMCWLKGRERSDLYNQRSSGCV